MSQPRPQSAADAEGAADAGSSSPADPGTAPLDRVGVVVIGRNEGDRLDRALAAVPNGVGACVYVDSGSADGSAARARAAAVDVIELDPSHPFSAGRARNEGFERLTRQRPELFAVQFVDGDCELAPDWLERAVKALSERDACSAVHGRVRELDPARSPYNRLCEIEWGMAPPGDSASVGGIFLVRADRFREVGGFDPTVIAAEDDELSVRLRRAGGTLLRVADPMVTHDAAMTRVGQWWQRAVRLGHAYAQVSELHPALFRREKLRAWSWALALPLLTAACAAAVGAAGLALLLLYPADAARIARASRRDGLPAADARLWGAACVVSRFAQVQGMLRYRVRRRRRRPLELIEYKEAGPRG